MKKKIWIDIENTPHVLFFKPIIESLQKFNYDIVITARNYGGITKLLEMNNLKFTLIGSDYGKRKLNKIIGVVGRIIKLYFFIKKKNITVSISHGSRTHIGAAWLARIPSITSYDYEYSSKFLVHKLTSKVIVPSLIPDNFFINNKISLKNIVRYNGFKEQIYLNDFKPQNDNQLLHVLGIDTAKIIVLVRPPAFNSHYFTEKSDQMFKLLLEKLNQFKNLFIIFSPRDKSQKLFLNSIVSKYNFESYILKDEVDGLNLIWCCDLIFSGGGTMNREAALLGVPVYSIFGGKVGALDSALNEMKRLFFIRNKSDFDNIKFVKREVNVNKILKSNVKDEIINEIIKMMEN